MRFGSQGKFGKCPIYGPARSFDLINRKPISKV